MTVPLIATPGAFLSSRRACQRACPGPSLQSGGACPPSLGSRRRQRPEHVGATGQLQGALGLQARHPPRRSDIYCL